MRANPDFQNGTRTPYRDPINTNSQTPKPNHEHEVDPDQTPASGDEMHTDVSV